MSERPTFEIGLVMAGAISAGAYTAGALDFLIEALDAWDEAKARGDAEAPPHDVRLKVIAGASAGGICAAIAAVALGRDFAHVSAGNLGSASNPFFKPWVEDIDISVLLDNGDLEDDEAQVLSILNATGLPRIVDTVLDTAEPPKRRRYVAEPLPVRFTVGNLKGIPYEIGMRGNTAAGHAMRVHGDDYSFLVGAPPAGPPDPPVPPDWVAVTGGSSSGDPAWRKLGTACLASGAFPLFLLPKALRRERHALLDRRTFVIPGDGTNDPHHGTAREVEIEPTWPTPQPADPYDFLCVDGGTMNNEPLELARHVLAGGKLAHNPRAGKDATRAVLMIDPFVDPADLGPGAGLPVTGLIGPLTDAWTMQCRFKPTDLVLAHEDDVYSRFLLAPSRGSAGPATRHPCASGGLGGFLGFFHRAFREHDYLLGRRNCQRFLARHFALPADNPLFAEWPQALKDALAIPDPAGPHLPVIPLLGSAGAVQPLPEWPSGRLDPKSLEPAIEARADKVFERLVAGLGTLQRWYVWAGWKFGARSLVVDKAIGAVADAMKGQKL
ncbi:MAG: patatin-like phospholipase family protein [Thalassobaculum sp.]|uniref:hypothetical protein n=1 Tax=Thalassobaculum sp. TaxID=2022740 RepID=UPI0032ED5B8D